MTEWRERMERVPPVLWMAIGGYALVLLNRVSVFSQLTSIPVFIQAMIVGVAGFGLVLRASWAYPLTVANYIASILYAAFWTDRHSWFWVGVGGLFILLPVWFCRNWLRPEEEPIWNDSDFTGDSYAMHEDDDEDREQRKVD